MLIHLRQTSLLVQKNVSLGEAGKVSLTATLRQTAIVHATSSYLEIDSALSGVTLESAESKLVVFSWPNLTLM